MSAAATAAIALVGAHFFGDWLLQPRWMATRKSKNPLVLIVHVAILTLPLWALSFFPLALSISAVGLLINAAAHFLIDATIWHGYATIVVMRHRREGSPDMPAMEAFVGERRYAEDYWFYATIAVDQFLHVALLLWLFL